MNLEQNYKYTTHCRIPGSVIWTSTRCRLMYCYQTRHIIPHRSPERKDLVVSLVIRYTSGLPSQTIQDRTYSTQLFIFSYSFFFILGRR